MASACLARAPFKHTHLQKPCSQPLLLDGEEADGRRQVAPKSCKRKIELWRESAQALERRGQAEVKVDEKADRGEGIRVPVEQ